ncbi:acyl-CoA synthetase [Cupriavidus sp. WS]|uniref:acyl-CoA synthetase n=1 Tax=Cupriavidus sp. WS TaxID=1312922 RepID=UPI00035CBCB6|nr:acyl-CoA synthetase [Cupriavidus sp. WS]
MQTWLTATLRVATQDDIASFEQVPLEARALPVSVYEAIRARAALQPGAPAIRYLPDGSDLGVEMAWSYAELVARITQIANFLSALGVGRADRVGILMPNTPEAHACLWAAETVGVACPINFMLEPSQISSILEEAGCKVLIAFGPHPDFDIWEKCQALRAGGLTHVLRATMAGVAESAGDDGEGAGGPAVLALAGYRACPADALSFAAVTDAATTAALFHTGGTTGAPKLAMHSHGNQVANSWAQALSMHMAPGHVRLCGLPLFHVNGAIANGLVLYMAGACLVLTGLKGYRDAGVVRNFWRIVDKYKAQSFAAVPTFLVSLAQVEIGDADISSLEFLRCGTAPLSRQLAHDFAALSGVDIMEGYGLTEGTSVSAMNPRFGEKRIGSVGLRMPYQRVQIRRMERGAAPGALCADNEYGLVYISGPNVIAGYLDAAETAAVFTPDGWYNTGDIGRFDADGYLWLTGRQKDIIIRGGHNLDPRMIEEALYAHPDVQHAAAIGRPDRYTGEMPVAYVTLRPGARVDSESLLRFAAERIPERAAVPKCVKIIREMPLTSVGKIFKPPLRKDAAMDGYMDALGGMIGAYNMTLSVEEEQGETLVRLVSTDLSPVHHAHVRRFVGDALKTFTFAHALTFASRY